MDVSDAQWFALQGTVRALKTAVSALIEAHAKDCFISQSLLALQLGAEAAALPKPVPEEFLAALQQTLDELVRVATEAEESSPSPRRSREGS